MINVAAWAGGDERGGLGGTEAVSEGHADDGAIGTEVVYIGTGLNFPDALGAGAAAALGVGPVLLVKTDEIPPETLTELNRLHPDRIVIVGGTAVVSAGVEASLAALSFSPTVTRIAGANRYATAAALSAATFPSTGSFPRAAHVGSTNLPDGNGAVRGLMTVAITAPAPGILLIDAGADFFAGPDTSVKCWIEIGSSFITWTGVVIAGSERFSELDASANSEEDCSTEVGINVAAGTHELQFFTEAAIGVSIADGAMTVLWVPYDGDGGVPIPLP